MRNPNPSDQASAISEINVTPLIDVMLCLLIIFMIAIPTMTGRVTLDLPQPIDPPRTKPNPPTEINVLADGRIMLDHRPASAELIAAEMAFQIARDKDHMVAIAADQEARYDQVLAVIASAKEQGVDRIAMK